MSPWTRFWLIVLAAVADARRGAGKAADEFAAMIAHAIEQARRGSPAVADLAHKMLLTLDEAAALSGLSRGHLREAVREGELKARVIGRGYKVKREALEAYVKKL